MKFGGICVMFFWRSLWFPVYALLATTIAAQPSSSQALPKITVGLGPAVDFLPAFVARDKGIFEKHGIDVTLLIVPTPSVVPPMLVSQSVQIAYATPPNLLLADEGGLDLVAIEGAARLGFGGTAGVGGQAYSIRHRTRITALGSGTNRSLSRPDDQAFFAS